jgi:hypothetical protein
MAGPPSVAFGQLTLLFGGSLLPEGAAVTLGHLWPSDLDFFNGLAAELEPVHEGTAAQGCTLEAMLIKQGPSATGPSQVIPLGIDGDQGPPAANPGTATIIEKVVPGVSGRLFGRLYYPCTPRLGVVAGGTLDSDFITQLQSVWADFYQYMNSFDADPQVFPTTSSDPRTVTALRPDGRIGTQRRRNRR